ncbi:hypothetical protein TKK_0001938 [Trichogramma kaykai]
MSGSDDSNKGAKRRSGIPLPTTSRARVPQAAGPDLNLPIPEDPNKDSGLSSEGTTPVNGSPTLLPRRMRMSDIIAASKARLRLAECERLANSRSRLQQLNSRSGTDSPRSLDSTRSRQIYSPLRTPTQIGTKLPIPLDISSPRDEDLVTIDRTTLNNCYHDIVTMKTIILKLKRVIQEPGENGLTRNFPLTPFEVQNGLSDLIEPSLEDTVDTMGTTTCSESSTDSHYPVKVSVSTQTPVSDSAPRRLSSATPDSAHVKLDNDEVLQLKKQVQICKAKLQEKDAEIFKLKADVQEYQLHHGRIQGIRYSPDESLCTASEKLRPASLLPPLSNNSSSTGSLASSNGSSTQSSTPRSSPPMPRQQKSIPTRIQEPMRSSLPSLQRLQYPRPVKTLQSPESPQMRKSLLPTPPLAAKRTTAATGIPKARAHSAPRR